MSLTQRIIAALKTNPDMGIVPRAIAIAIVERVSSEPPTDEEIESAARANYNDYFDGNDKWPDATDNERKLYKDGAKAALAAFMGESEGRG